MKVRVQLLGQLRGILNPDQEEVELPSAATVQDALRWIAAGHESARLQLVTEQGELRPSLLLVVNDTAIPARQAATIQLNEQDQLTVLPPISGG